VLLKSIFNTSFAGLIFLLIGVAMSIIAGHELLVSLRCGEQPTAITCAELTQRGRPASDFVTLTEFVPNWDGSIWCQDDRGQWATADVPLAVAGSAAPPAVVVRIHQPQSDEHLRGRLQVAGLTGVITGRGMYGDYGARLADFNPGIDPAACWIISLDRRPASPALVGAIAAAGVGLFTLSMLLFVFVRPPASPEQATIRMMSPLVLLIEGLHALADRLPLPSHCVRGAVLLPAGMALATYGGWRLIEIVQSTDPSASPDLGILPILLLDCGVALSSIALAFLLVDKDGAGQSETLALTPLAGVR
jgi:hypothetical protein